MNSDPSKLRQQQAEQTAELSSQSEARAATEFNSVEELIRADAARHPPPEAIADRLKDSIAREPVRREPWWRRLFRR